MKTTYAKLSVTECRDDIEIRGQMKRVGGLGFHAHLTAREAFQLWTMLGQTYVVGFLDNEAHRKFLYPKPGTKK